MRRRRLLPFALLALGAAPAAPSVTPEAREQAHRANNLGVARLEQYRTDDAVRAFEEALRLDPGLALARVNLAIARLNLPDLPGAEREAAAVLAADPASLHARYVLALALRAQGRGDEARAPLREIVARDPKDAGALVNLGQLDLQERRHDEAAAAFRAALEAEPAHGTALYNLGLALTRAGRRDEAQPIMQRFEALRASGAAKLLGTNYPEQGRYAEAVSATGVEPGLVDPAAPGVRFVDRSADLPEAARAASAPADAGSGALLFDFDGDGALDLLDVRAAGLRLLRNAGGRFEDATAAAGLAAVRGGRGALVGDCDADGQLDLVVLRDDGPGLFRRAGATFVDATAAAGLAEPAGAARFTTAALADVDHDGDVDLFVAGVGRARPAEGAAPRLYRNDGSCAFKEDAAAAGLAASPLPAVAVVASDTDNGRDIDLLLLPDGAAPRLHANRRDGTFADASVASGLSRAARFLSLGAGDVDKDGFVDLFLGAAGGPDLLARRDARGVFVVADAPLASRGSGAALFVDVDGDGLLDLATLGASGLRLLRNRGAEWADVSSSSLVGLSPDARGVAPAEAPRALHAGDLDGDGDVDLVLRAMDGGLRLLRNDGPARAFVRVRLDGLVSNRAGLGAKVELRAGSLWQKLETYAAAPAVAPADVLFGLGRRATADAVRVLWPSGIVQTETLADLPADGRRALAVEELDRKPSSCPYLYAWDGQRFRFLTDFLGGGEMGYLVAPGLFNTPDPVEHVRLPPEVVRARAGRVELRVTNELEEGLFVDRLALTVVTHDADVGVFPNEGMTTPPKPERLWAVRGLRPPLGARDHAGRDVLDRLRHVDRRFVDDLPVERVRGYARSHALTLDLGDAGSHPLLLLTGWTDYAFSSDNRAAAQAGLALRPPSLQVRDAAGEWRTAIEQIGVPVGRPQTVVVDLGGLDLGPSREVRIVTSMRIYWDQAQVGEAADEALETRVVEAETAELRERGFSAPVSPDGREPFFDFAYAQVSRLSPWKAFPGRYTRLGDVRALLRAGDDAFVVARPGDEIALAFDAPAEPAPGRAQTLLLLGDGYSKEMDPNSAAPHALEPLPFRAMARYPYGPEARAPRTRATAAMERLRTRVVRAPLPPLAPEPR